MTKLKGKLVKVDENYAVTGYVSGHNEAQFYQYILDGMYHMELSEMSEEKKKKHDAKKPKLSKQPVKPSRPSSRASSQASTPTPPQETLANAGISITNFEVANEHFIESDTESNLDGKDADTLKSADNDPSMTEDDDPQEGTLTVRIWTGTRSTVLALHLVGFLMDSLRLFVLALLLTSLMLV